MNMAFHHNNRLNMVGLFDSDEAYDSPYPSSGMVPHTTSDDMRTSNIDMGYFHDYVHTPSIMADAGNRPFGPEHFIAEPSGSQDQEQNDEDYSRIDDSVSVVSYTPPDDSDYEESACEDITLSKAPKTNKDGAPRKARQPRPKLLKWSDNDWKNVVLGIIWACGENGIRIPFSQAAQLVGETCTASALQQAVLKLRCKQIADGHDIPLLKMAWTRKNRNGRSSSPIADAKNTYIQTPPKTPTRKRCAQKGKESLIVKFKIGRRGVDRMRPGSSTFPVNNLSSDMSTEGCWIPGDGSFYQDQLQVVQQPLEWTTKPEHNLRYMTGMTKAQPEDYGEFGSSDYGMYGTEQHAQVGHGLDTSSFPQMIEHPSEFSEQRKLYNRKHSVVGDVLLDRNNLVVGTTNELRSFKGMVTPENNPFDGGYLTNVQGQAAIGYNDTYVLSDLYSQAHNQADLPQDNFPDFSALTDYEAYTVSNNSQVPLSNTFKAESPEAFSYNPHFFS